MWYEFKREVKDRIVEFFEELCNSQIFSLVLGKRINKTKKHTQRVVNLSHYENDYSNKA